MCRIPDNCSIYTAELRAVYLTLKLISQSNKQSFLVLSDSLSVLKSIANLKYDHPLSVDLLSLHSRLVCDNRYIVFAWVPGHVGIRGNNLLMLLTWQLNVLWRSLSIRDWLFLTLILRC